MKKITTVLASLLLMGAVAVPAISYAQDQKKAPAKAAPAARSAAPRPAARAVAPRPAARAARPTLQRQAAPQRRAPAVNRAAQHQQRIQLRRQAQQPKIQAQPKAQSKIQAQPNAQLQSQAQSKAQSKAAAQLNTRQQQRAERTLRRQENRQLRSLPAAQRAAKREEIRNARELRTQQRNQAAQPNAVASPSAAAQTRAQRRAARRNGQARVTAQAARQGRFAARAGALAANANATTRAQRRAARISARRAWRQGLRAAFVPWYGPVFWPYAYSDIFDYAFWPGGYDDGFWDYAYDDFFDGLFWGQGGPPADYAYAPEASGPAAPRASVAGVSELCKQPGSGVTAWPFADITKKVGLNDDQKTLLDDMKAAAQKAAGVFKASCPAEAAFPLTPPGRLQAMTTRLQATLESVNTVKPALDKFYNSLSDEQKERFNELGPKGGAKLASANETTAQASADTANTSCGDPKPGLTNLPIEKIEDAINPTDAQAAGLQKLQDATGQAVGKLQAACPDQTPLTPPGRLDAMATRLQAMIDAANTVKPALDGFYASLTNEQKARFNTIGGELASGG